MTRRILLVLALTLTCVSLFAQTEPLPRGVRFLASPVKPISTETAEEGQRVEMTMAADIVEVGKGTIVPKGAKLFGWVTHVVPRGKDRPAELSIRLDRVEWKNGSLPLQAYMFLQQPVEPVSAKFVPKRIVMPRRCSGDPETGQPMFVMASTMPTGEIEVVAPESPFRDVNVKVNQEHVTVAISPLHDIVLTNEAQVAFVQLEL